MFSENEALALTPYKERIYERVEASVIPESVWGKNDGPREYFSKLKTLTIADVSSPYDRTPQFPVHKDIFQNQPKGFEERIMYDLVYKNGEFEFSGIGPDFRYTDGAYDFQDTESNHRSWYATGRKMVDEPVRPNKDCATINYKGTKLKIKSGQQIFDPETRQLLSFMRYTKLSP